MTKVSSAGPFETLSVDCEALSASVCQLPTCQLKDLWETSKGMREHLAENMPKILHNRVLVLNDANQPVTYEELKDLLTFSRSRLSEHGEESFLTPIKHLDLSNSDITDTQLALLLIEDISSLSTLTRLTSLDLSQTLRIKDLSSLSSLKELKFLDVSQLRFIDDLSPLSSLLNLTTLKIHSSPNLVDLSPLSPLLNLTTLELKVCCRLVDITPLAPLDKLHALSLYNCYNLRSVKPLSSLDKLAQLDIRKCRSVPDLASLSSRPHLMILSGNHRTPV